MVVVSLLHARPHTWNGISILWFYLHKVSNVSDVSNIISSKLRMQMSDIMLQGEVDQAPREGPTL